MVHRVIILGLIALSGVAHGRSYSDEFLGFTPAVTNQPYTKENMVRGIQGVTVVDVGDPKTKVLIDNDKRYVCPVRVARKPACSGPAVRYSAKKPKDYCYAIKYATLGDKLCFPSNDDTGVEFKSANNCQSGDKSPVYLISRNDFKTMCGQLPTQHKYAFYPQNIANFSTSIYGNATFGNGSKGGSSSSSGSSGSNGIFGSVGSSGSFGSVGSGGSGGSSSSGGSGGTGGSSSNGGSNSYKGSGGSGGSGGSNVAGGSGGSSGSNVFSGGSGVPSAGGVAGDSGVGGLSGVSDAGDLISASIARDLGCLNVGAALPYCEFEIQYVSPTTIGATLPIMFNNQMMTVRNVENNLYSVTNNVVGVGNFNHNIVYNIADNFKGNMMG